MRFPQIESATLFGASFVLVLMAFIQTAICENKVNKIEKEFQKVSKQLEISELRLQQNLDKKFNTKLKEVSEYDVRDKVFLLDKELEELRQYTRDTRKYVEWER